jgi:IS30 family transposase
VLVLHERVTLANRHTRKTAGETISAMLAVFGRIDPHLRRSITFDNDTAFAQHGLLRTMRDMTTWFCDGAGIWSRTSTWRQVELAFQQVKSQLPPEPAA